MQILNLSNIYTLNHVFSQHVEREEEQPLESDSIENQQHSILLLPEIQSSGAKLLQTNSEPPPAATDSSSVSSVPFLFYKFRSNRGFSGHIVYKILQKKKKKEKHHHQLLLHAKNSTDDRDLLHANSNATNHDVEKQKEKEQQLITVRMIDVSHCSIFHPNKYSISCSALVCSLGKHAQLFANSQSLLDVGQVEEIESNFFTLPNALFSPASECNFGEQTTATEIANNTELSTEPTATTTIKESLDAASWVQGENDNRKVLLRKGRRFELDYLKVMRQRLLNFKSTLNWKNDSHAYKKSMNILENLGYDSRIRIDVSLEMTKILETDILNEIVDDLSIQRGIPKSEVANVDDFISKDNVLLKDQHLFRMEGYKHSSYVVLDGNNILIGEIRPKVTLSRKHLQMNIVNNQNELRYVIRNYNTSSNRIFSIEDMIPKILVSLGSSFSAKKFLKSGRIIKQATGFSKKEITAPLKNMVIDFPPYCQPYDQVLLFGAMLVIELEYNMSKKQLQSSHPTLLY